MMIIGFMLITKPQVWDNGFDTIKNSIGWDAFLNICTIPSEFVLSKSVQSDRFSLTYGFTTSLFQKPKG